MAFTEALCPQIQQQVNNAFLSNAPAMKYRRIGFLQALMSSINTAGVQKIQLDGGISGKRREVQLVWSEPYCQDVAAAALDCTDFTNNDEPVLQEQIITIPANPFTSVDGSGNAKRLKFTTKEMAKLCENNAQFLANHIMQWMRGLEEGMDAALLAQFVGQVGLFADGSASKGIPLFALASGLQAAIPSAVEKIENEYSDILANGTPIIVGGNAIKNYSNRLKIGCCNMWGVNMSAAAGQWYFFNDQFIEDAFGANNFVALAPGAVQLVTWNEFAGSEAANHEEYQAGTIVSPLTGMEYDFRIFWDVKCKQYFVEMYSYSQLVTAPAGGCGLTGANGTLRFNACVEEESITCADS